MRNILLLLLVTSLLITSACKKASTPSGPTTYGTFTLGDSTYTVTGYNYNGANSEADVSSNTVNELGIIFVSPNYPPVVGTYPLGINAGDAYMAMTSKYYGSFKIGNTNQNLVLTTQSNGYLNYSTPTIWVYNTATSGTIVADSLPFSVNVSIPSH